MRTRTLLVLALVATVGSIWLAGVAGAGRAARALGGNAADTGRITVVSNRPGRDPQALAVLHRWDRRRSQAWASGDVVALSRLYEPASAAGRRDVGDLRRWTHRGLRVTGLRQQVAALRVVRSERRRLLVEVTGRTVGGMAIGAGRRTPVPNGGWTTDRISLAKVSGRWRVAEVWAQPAR